MRVTKYIHSCLTVEDGGEKVLFDPGTFSFIEGRVRPETFADVANVVVTHDHPDHLDVGALKQILELSGAGVVANGEVAAKLGEEGIAATAIEEGELAVGAFTLRATPAAHEAILSDTTPRNTAFLVNGRLLNPGDSFREPLLAFAGVEALVLLLPVTAPFLTEIGAFEFAKRMRPAAVLPVHDGFAKEFFLRQRYETYRTFFEREGIRFHGLAEPGASVVL